MKALSFGSLNMDFVYTVPRFTSAGETLLAEGMETFCGGKGLNQSIALARAGAEVYHAGVVGDDGEILVEKLQSSGVDTSHIKVVKGLRTGHAIIQRNLEGENSILVYGGSNQMVAIEQIDEVLEDFTKGDFLILQNEISQLGYLIRKGKDKGMTVVLNPSPMDEDLRALLPLVDYLVLNEVEMEQLVEASVNGLNIGEGCGACDPCVGPGVTCFDELLKYNPGMKIVLTLGKEGAVYVDRDSCFKVEALRVPVKDTTGAGDTFTGYFVAEVMKGKSPEDAMKMATRAAAIAVTRDGASDSIPTLEEVESLSL